MEVCRELDSLMVAPVVGQLVGVWQEKRWVRGVVEKVEDDGCVWLHGVDHLCYIKIDQLSQKKLKHLPEVSLLVSAQCNTVRLVKSKLVRNMVDKVFRVNLRGEKNGFLRVELLAANNDNVKKHEDINNETSKEAKAVNAEKAQALPRNVTLKVGKMMDLTVLHVDLLHEVREPQ